MKSLPQFCIDLMLDETQGFACESGMSDPTLSLCLKDVSQNISSLSYTLRIFFLPKCLSSV